MMHYFFLSPTMISELLSTSTIITFDCTLDCCLSVLGELDDFALFLYLFFPLSFMTYDELASSLHVRQLWQSL